MAEEIKKLVRLADAVVTLSETDRRYWSRCNPRSVFIPNPCYVKASECRRAAYGKHILWLGRISSTKQPLEIPRIMREVRARDPGIVCHVVGADDANLEKKLRESIAAEGLSGNVIMEGFHADVTPYYENCALFLLTSRFEGFTQTLFEAASFGLPTVLYEMPWLPYNDLIDGAITAPQLDAEAAAEAIVRVINDPEEWQRRSNALYNSALRYEETDITAYWVSLIESLEKGTLPDEPHFDRETEILLDQIDAFHEEAVSGLIRDRDQKAKRIESLTQERDQKAKKVESLTRDRDQKAKKVESLTRDRDQKAKKVESLTRERDCEARRAKSREEELESIKGSVSFRLGRAMTWAPRRARGLVRCCREHDAKYTFARILFHLHLGPDNDKHNG